MSYENVWISRDPLLHSGERPSKSVVFSGVRKPPGAVRHLTPGARKDVSAWGKGGVDNTFWSHLAPFSETWQPFICNIYFYLTFPEEDLETGPMLF